MSAIWSKATAAVYSGCGVTTCGVRFKKSTERLGTSVAASIGAGPVTPMVSGAETEKPSSVLSSILSGAIGSPGGDRQVHEVGRLVDERVVGERDVARRRIEDGERLRRDREGPEEDEVVHVAAGRDQRAGAALSAACSIWRCGSAVRALASSRPRMIEWQVVSLGSASAERGQTQSGLRRIGAARDERRRRAQEEERGRGDHQLAGGAAQAGGIVAAEEEHGVAVAGGERAPRGRW